MKALQQKLFILTLAHPIVVLILTIFASGLFMGTMASPENGDIRTRLRMEYFNDSGEKKLVCTLLAKIDKRYEPLEGEAINFYVVSDTLAEPLGSETTDGQGKATWILGSNNTSELYFGDGLTFQAEFSGYDRFQSSTAEKEVKDVVMSIEFSKKDTNKFITFNLQEVADDGILIPVDGVPVSFNVPRTFTLLEFGEGELSNGLVNIEFPTDIPGDTIGFITIVAKIDDDDTYGSLSASNGINWGKVVPPEKEVKRGLGDTNAPLWMVYTLIVLLSLVWFHYLYAIFTIFRIKKEGNKLDLPEGQTG